MAHFIKGDPPRNGRKLVRFRVGLGTVVSLLIALTVGAASWATYLSTRAAIESQTNKQVAVLLRELDNRVRNHLLSAVPAVETARMLMRDSLVRTDYDSLARQFIDLMRNNPNFSWVGYGDETGVYTGAYRERNATRDEKANRGQKNTCTADPDDRGQVFVSQSTSRDGGTEREYKVEPSGQWVLCGYVPKNYDYDPRTDDFYSAAKAAKSRVWVGPYIFNDEGVPGVSCALPYYASDGRLLGVFDADFDLNVLSQFLKELRFGKHGRVFILTRDGALIADPDVHIAGVTGKKSEGKLITVQNANDPVLAAWFDAWKKTAGTHQETTSGQFLLHLDDGSYLAGYRGIPMDKGLTWILGAVAPESDFLGVLHENEEEAFLIALGSIVAGLLVTLGLARRIAAPLGSLAVEMDGIGEFRLQDRPALATRFREVAMMDDSLRKMKGGLRSFAYYVPTGLVRTVLASGQEARLEGRTRDLTVFFCDIAGFTSIAETMTPDELVQQLSRYLDEMTRIIAALGGTVDKFIGDAIMAFWGAPASDPQHAANACEAAVRCQRKLAEFRASADIPWFANLHARIGIASGDALVGNVGTPERFNYTVMGDTVNLASRLESLGKQYGAEILVSEATYRAAKSRVIGRPIDIVQVKGKHEGVRIYELIGLVSDQDLRAVEMAEAFEKALAAYLARDFKAALELLHSLPSNGMDRPAAVLRERCERYLMSPPPQDWNGIYIATEK